MLLEVNHLTKSFHRQENKFSPVNDLSFALKDGEFVIISGRSGAGKTTFFNLISGLIQADHGEISFEGERVDQFDDESSALFRNEKIGYLLQTPTLIKSLNVMENIMFPFYLANREGDPSERAMSLLIDLEISYLQNASVETLSGGELKRVALARSLINHPRLLLLDEPTSDLDEETAKEMINYLEKLNQEGTTVMVISHDEDFLKLDKRQAIYKDGQLHEKEAITS